MQEIIDMLLDTTNTIGDVCDELEVVDTPELVEEVYQHIQECDICGLWTTVEELYEGTCPHCLEEFDNYLDECDD